MSRRLTLALIVAATLGLAACQGQTAPTLTDPREILAAAVRTTAEQSTVRIDAAIDGQVAVDLLGSGGAPIDLSGSTVSADVDLTGGKARATFNVSLLTGELIAVDRVAYLKTTLTGAQYMAVPIGPLAPTGPSADPTTILSGLTDLLAQPGLDPVKGDDVECGGTTCYAVEIALTPDELAGLGGLELPTDLPIPIPIPDLSSASVALTVLVTKDTTRLAGLRAAVDLGDTGDLDLDVTFSKWSEAVTVVAPPADQVAPEG